MKSDITTMKNSSEKQRQTDKNNSITLSFWQMTAVVMVRLMLRINETTSLSCSNPCWSGFARSNCSNSHLIFFLKANNHHQYEPYLDEYQWELHIKRLNLNSNVSHERRLTRKKADFSPPPPFFFGGKGKGGGRDGAGCEWEVCEKGK